MSRQANNQTELRKAGVKLVHNTRRRHARGVPLAAQLNVDVEACVWAAYCRSQHSRAHGV